MSDTPEPIDLDRYFARIGAEPPDGATLETLRHLHDQHVQRIPFENLDVQMGLPIRLDHPSLEAKLVHGGRGGYCFEQNALFAAVLRQLGFRVTTLLARVRLTPGITPRTHMILRVDLPEGPFIADVGFGGSGPNAPLRLDAEDEQPQRLDTFRLVDEGPTHRLDARFDGAWGPLYQFTLEEHFPVDYEVANHYTSTHPASRFVKTLIATVPRDGGRLTLRNRELTFRRGASAEQRLLESDDEIVVVLEQAFGLRVQPGARFRALA